MEVVSLDLSFHTIEVRSKRISRMNKIVVVRDRFETKVEMWNPKYKSPQSPVSLVSCPIERCLHWPVAPAVTTPRGICYAKCGYSRPEHNSLGGGVGLQGFWHTLMNLILTTHIFP